MKILRNDELAVLYRSFRFARRHTLGIGMLGLFPFSRSELDGLRPEPELWAVVADAMGDAVLDEGYPKPAAEFKVLGQAHAPGGKPVQEMLVSARIGSLAKQLLVLGDRHFNALGMISATTPFLTMPLTPAQAFGGPDVAANPAGKGAQAVLQADGSEQWPLPNVEWMARRIVSRGDRAEPAGFWPLDPAAPSRVSQLGQFNDAWMKHTWPHLPDDTRAEYFHTVPSDQRQAGFFSGDEAIELRGMHATHATLEARLPGLRARCFVNRRQSNGTQRFSEVEARLETVWLFPELECGIVLYRAQSDTVDEDASDVLHVMAEWERLKETPRSVDHYEALFRQRLQEDAGAATATAEVAEMAVEPAAAVPAIPAAAAVAALAVPLDMPAPIAQAYDAIAELEARTEALLRSNGLTQADLAGLLAPQPELPAVSLAQAEQAADQLEAQTREIMRKNNLSDADLAPYLKQPVDQPVTLAEVKSKLRQLDEQTHELLQKNNMTEQDVQQFLASRPELADASRNLADARAADVPLSAIPDVAPILPAVGVPQAALESMAAAAMALPLPASGKAARAQLTRDQVIARHAARDSLSGYDLSGVDLSKLDLAGADFSGSLLEKTVFAGSRLANANLSGCLMQGADCSEADFSGVNLAQASAAGASFAKSRLSAAQLTDADFTGADFSEAQLQQAVLNGASFEQAAMGKLQAVGATAQMTNFSMADLSGADFGQALLTRAMFNDSKLAAANFKAARCDQAEFYGADASGAQFAAASMNASRADAASKFGNAVFDGAQMRRAAWEGAQLAGAQFVGAQLDDADFSGVQAPGANFRQASASQAKFGRADLSRADMTGANLFKGSLRKSRVEDAVLHFANLYGVDFDGVTVRRAALEGANTEQTLFAFRPPLA